MQPGDKMARRHGNKVWSR
ncbi:hypothetical protein [Pseudomonas bharatica]|nr:hypothetical protein [Pseudomonas bharatica]